MALPEFLARIVGWLRAGYPDGVPPYDYIPLVAVLGTHLSDDEIELVASELDAACASGTAEEIRKAIRSVTRADVRESDIARVRSHLAAGGWPLAGPGRD